jgi:hypothetical protein
MRSSLVFAANREIPNRFQLCQTISKAARVLHLNNNPTESTINRVLQNLPPSVRAERGYPGSPRLNKEKR